MNKYEIEGQEYEAMNEYEAVKDAYKMALSVEMVKYIGNNTWEYVARFSHGNAQVFVTKI